MIEIDCNKYIGQGDIRTCYEHPTRPNLCIKILKPEIDNAYASKEILYLKKIAKKKRLIKASFYANFRGEVKTNLGQGQMFDLIRDETTGNVSKTLEYYLKQSTPTLTNQVIESAVLKLKHQMITHKVFTRDLRARNLCCKLYKNGTIEIIIIDGIGHRDFIPVADFLKCFSKVKVNRSFKKWHSNSLKNNDIFYKAT